MATRAQCTTGLQLVVVAPVLHGDLVKPRDLITQADAGTVFHACHAQHGALLGRQLHADVHAQRQAVVQAPFVFELNGV